jgi:zinc transporter 9
MKSEDLSFIMMCLVMFITTTCVGLLPAKIKASQRVLNLVSIIGAGLLVGAALIVIIPEGFATLLSAVHK